MKGEKQTRGRLLRVINHGTQAEINMGRIREGNHRPTDRGMSNIKKVSRIAASPSCVMAQLMSSEPIGRSQKYEPLETREFVEIFQT